MVRHTEPNRGGPVTVARLVAARFTSVFSAPASARGFFFLFFLFGIVQTREKKKKNIA